MDVVNVQEDMQWLIEQAERVQELEEDLTKYRNGFEFQLLINNSIKKQNKRYREVINNINEKAMLYGVDEEVYEAIQDAIKALEGEE